MSLRTIGQVARLSGLPVPTVRFYSDAGLVPPVDRTPGGYRLYDQEALSRLELIRTLRDLGIDLATITRVLTGARTLAEVAGRQAEALETQIQTLRVRQAVLRYAAARGTDAAGLAQVNRLARLSDEQRRVLVSDLIDEAAGGLDMEPGFAARVRLLPGLPAEAAPEQIEAWIELAHLVGDAGFRAGVRRAFERHAADRASGADRGDPESWRRAENAVLEMAGAARARGLSPVSAEARPIAEELAAVFAAAHRREDDAEFRGWLAERIRVGADPDVSRYWRLLAVINGEETRPDPVPAARWFLAALSGPERDNGAMRIRAVRDDELPILQDIEWAAGESFRAIGMPEIADDEPFPLDVLASYRRAGRAWVAVGDSDRPVAYLLADLVDGNLHVEQVSVHPDSAGRGVGRSLLDHLAGLATADGIAALTLTTFTEVPWNAPYYERCGFRCVDEADLTPGLRELRDREAAHGLDRWPRVCMRRDL
jgi:DNA-binding transcriptional MerR regulator/ribosomal protein S18 acetylase RimI-like enzyme